MFQLDCFFLSLHKDIGFVQNIAYFRYKYDKLINPKIIW